MRVSKMLLPRDHLWHDLNVARTGSSCQGHDNLEESWNIRPSTWRVDPRTAFQLLTEIFLYRNYSRGGCIVISVRKYKTKASFPWFERVDSRSSPLSSCCVQGFLQHILIMWVFLLNNAIVNVEPGAGNGEPLSARQYVDSPPPICGHSFDRANGVSDQKFGLRYLP